MIRHPNDFEFLPTVAWMVKFFAAAFIALGIVSAIFAAPLIILWALV